jgi:hypothetical protein
VGPLDGWVLTGRYLRAVGLVSSDVLARGVGVVELVEDIDSRSRQPGEEESERK